mmetsp:Transcript_36232/g.55656  ORF Transcript_36232/g.55656 Transcript_36232/m.55656 type:complete len:679 (+) Transcript_36232:84-2120(+)|eukprot:CAMPEP_0118687636 /NCGR_PEP_ID=MMETSP0800-20121206/8492_1 /TAXON_ID=210618 ORGANISM="Striatella unipunctata, Strain CCMP2910" /NCGR_SAMPLE_ID=MMETSP0800 /ASSEMBLY_ACC=CAM_ASM_000638 /LENGTH=678 /DNA_ID=CAMNT_0006584841 /DNA_START=65 /DNA_END=2101 /DNA_ORIENTATION=+
MRKRNRTTSPAMAFMVLLSAASPVAGFQAPLHGRKTTRIMYQASPEGEAAFMRKNGETRSAAERSSRMDDKQPMDVFRMQMPTWLRQPKGHLAYARIIALQEAMMNSYFSEAQTNRLLDAIHEAAAEDRNKVAGAAEFCLMLLDTMEMGINTLVAAAFHFCSCVSAREREALTQSYGGQGKYVSKAAHRFGDHVQDITKDASRLKELETISSTLMRTTKQASPDSQYGENYMKLLLSETKDWRALAIRSGACLFRLRGILHDVTETSKDGIVRPLTSEEVRVCREAYRIYSPLASRLGMQRMKNEIENTAFRVLHRRQYERLRQLVLGSQKIKDPKKVSETSVWQNMRNVLENVSDKMTEVIENDEFLRDNAETCAITTRVKEPYSLWKKMLRKGVKNVLDIPDTLAIRIVLGGKEDEKEVNDEEKSDKINELCYYVQDLCKEHLRPAEGNERYKDYIKSPKRNGYQSLHYTAETAFGGDEWNVEVQVRTTEMHQVAEYGVAAHWDYKLQVETPDNSGNKNDYSLDTYLKSVEDWRRKQGGQANDIASSPISNDDCSEQSHMRVNRVQERAARIAPYIQALDMAKTDLSREQLFVFLSSSTDDRVLALPAGSCIVDALRETEKLYGMNVSRSTDGIYKNGIQATVTQLLQNGDVLDLPLEPCDASLHEGFLPAGKTFQ